MVCVKTFYYKHEAELAQGLLEANGVASMISAADAGGMRPDYVFGMGGIRLYVEERDKETALEILGAET